MSEPIQMVDLKTQYLNIKEEIDDAIREVIDSTRFIKGPVVERFTNNLQSYLGVRNVITCANGTDALQLAMMALDLQPGDEVLVPAFTYVATAEVIALMRLTPVMVDAYPDSFNINVQHAESLITENTKAIVPVHLFGQNAHMEAVMDLAEKNDLYVIEDAAQSIGSKYIFSDGKSASSGTMGHIGTTSFFPSKNLGCYGDGGAVYTNDDQLAKKISMIANHGQNKRYYHEMVGVNSRLDAIQAAVLDVKLKYLDDYIAVRQSAAQYYDSIFGEVAGLEIPGRSKYSTHAFHQYTLKVADGQRDSLQQFLSDQAIPSMIYYPVPLYEQNAFKPFVSKSYLDETEKLCNSVLSLPIHSELKGPVLQRIADAVVDYFVQASTK